MTQRSVSSSKLSPVVLPPVLLPSTSRSPTGFAAERPHELECRIQRSLQAQPGLRFSRLTVHQCEQGVCLEGSLEANDDGVDLCELVNQIAGVKAINHVVTHGMATNPAPVIPSGYPATVPVR